MQSLKREDVTLENIEQLLPEMTALYKKVSSKADFNLGDFNLETYIRLKERLHDNYLLKVYFLDGESRWIYVWNHQSKFFGCPFCRD